ncbi:hypothetical protein CKAN_02084000 [Cinnamomum micranthum f. kanehirae]|uniref:Uncharacterized protein n=1 Tax=Cinnamomum micranthum f. kanehirae TaxID=337451 RepID=A0A443PLL8_9MAGN|nr:hypothetical protein CKAN_02084000 [Cinnamomum micranthum f. kanehirae]
MRIRKNAKLSSFPPSSSSTPLRTCPALQTYVCQLNRSPWDVMSFSPPPQDSSNPSQHQQHHHQGNGISFAAASDSEDSSEGEEEKIEDDSREERKCKKEAKQGHSVEEIPAHQRETPSRESYSTAVTSRRNRGRAAPASDYYYYYSGFGPLWGKTRRGRRKERDGSVGGHLKWAPQSSTASTPTPPPPSSSSSSSDHVNEEEDDGVYRKRARKPMKSRSLKSLL